MKPALLVIDMQNDFKKEASPYSCQMLNDKLILLSNCGGATSYVKNHAHEDVHKFTLEELKERTPTKLKLLI